MSKTKIAFVIDTIETDAAGTQRQLLETIRRLDKSRFHAELISLWESEWLKSNSLPCECNIIGFRGFMKSDCVRMFRKFGRLIDERGIRIIQTFFEDSIFFVYFGSYFAKTRPILISSRRDIGLGAGNRPWYHHLYRRFLPFVNKRYDCVIANSRLVKQHACQQEGLSLDKVKVIYNGVDIPNGTALEKPAVFRNCPDATIWVAIAASLTPVKRHDLLVQAISLIERQSNLPSFRVLLLGEGPEERNIKALAQQLGVLHKMEFVGAVKNVGAYLQHCDIGVLCSDREGLSNSILEYMSHKLPVVATDTGGNSELVSNETGRCVPVGDAQATAEALVSLMDDPTKRIRLGLAGYRRVSEEFTWDRAMANIQSLFDVVSSNGTRRLKLRTASSQ
jgi:glycosyltransferase involved in cell wall biosynthesis